MNSGGIKMLIGYARVSTQDQSLDRQIDSLKAVNCQKIYQEKITDRPELDKLLENLRPGDIIIKSELTRLS
jgi:DNA invertase Pin-like site-specific DNA recombinase